MKKFKFIDLFAGIGGFHIAMQQLGGECVFAAEIDDDAISTYKSNFDIDARCDVTKVNPNEIPKFDVLCAGFPCQAFSKAGQQKGFSDTRGTLFFEIERILLFHLEKYKSPNFIVLENVRNLVSHDNGNTWETIKNHLKAMGYIMTETPIIVSPHNFGIPQLRERVLIFGIHKSVCLSDRLDFDFIKSEKNLTNALSILDNNVDEKYLISDYEEKILNAWDEFIKGINEKTIGFPIWLDFFQEQSIEDFPGWKVDFVNRNRKLYNDNKKFIDQWLKKYDSLLWAKPTDRKFEWQASFYIDSIWEGIIQFRPSGIRVKRPTEFPALVAMVHIPIIGWEKRRITPREAARLQCFPEDFKINPIDKVAYKQFGNSLNVRVIREVVSRILSNMVLTGKFNISD